MRRLAFTLVVWLCGCAALAAQTTPNGSIRGYVTDEQKGALQGVTLTATSPAVAGTQTAVSDRDGYFRLIDLPPGDYTITAELDGFAKFIREGIVVRAGLNLSLSIQMKVGTVSEQIQVQADTPMLESRSAGQSVNFSGDFQRAVPLARQKNWSDFLQFTPGVLSYISSAEFYYYRGSNLDAHVVLVDGAPVDSAFQGGTTYIKLGSETAQDVQVKLGGLDASAPLGTGAVINVTTPAGTNQFRGSVATTYQARGWNGNNAPNGGTSLASRVYLQDVGGGGPIATDRAWFFVSHRYQNRASGIDRTPAQVATLQALVPGFEPFDVANNPNLLFTKGTVRLSPRHQVSGFYQRDANPSDSAGATSGGIFSTQSSGGWGASARVESAWSDNVTTHVTASFTNKALNIDSAYEDRPGRAVYAGSVLSGGQRVGTSAVAFLDNYTYSGQQIDAPRATLAADASLYRSGWLGTHELQAGFYTEQVPGERSALTYANNGFILEDLVLRDAANPAAGTTPFHQRIYDATQAVSSNFRRSDLALYLQDTWRPTSRLTINAGVRLDWINESDALFHATTEDSLNVGPRVGANYLLSADGRNTLSFAYTRVHDAPFRTQLAVGSAAPGYRDLYDNDLDGAFETVFVTPASSAINSAVRYDPDYHQPYVDEWSAGYWRQLPGQWAIGIGTARRLFKDMTTQVETNGLYVDNVFRGYIDERQNAINLATNNGWNWPVYSDVQVQVTKQTARVQMIASYTRQWRHIAGTWQPNEPASFIQPDAFPNDKALGPTHRTDTNSLAGRGGDPMWKDHAARIAVNWTLPWGLQAAGTYSYQSGVWSGAVVTQLAAPDPRFGPPTVTLSNGRVVSNPLATVNRFAYATRGDGQFHLAGVHAVNLRLGRQFRFGGDRTFDAAVDLFNLLNGDHYEALQSGANLTYSPFYGQGSSLQPPRAAQLVLRVKF